MAKLPPCPNFKEKRCEQDELVCVSEDGKYYRFFCRNCRLFWVVSKDKTRAQAREANRVKKLQELSEQERERMRRTVFHAPKKGWLVHA